nr:DUF4249 domain-containing protein [Bacteroidota bacterium]
MRNLTIIFLLMICSFFMMSCEKVIDVDLNEDNPLLVIEGGLTSREAPDTVKLSWTGSYFGDGNFSKVTAADVSISDDAGHTEKLKEVSAGAYVTQNFKGMPGRLYQLNVKAEGKTYTASA